MRVSLACMASWLGFGVAFGVGCTGPTASTTDGSGSETDPVDCPVGSLNCACTPGGTCDGSLVCASKVCVSIDDTTSTGPEVTTGVTTSTETSNATVAGECSPANGQQNDACGPSEPYCSNKGECVPCTGLSSCASADPNKPACDAGSGLCVQCTADDASGCGGDTPVCDPGSKTCGPCSEHAQCIGSACDLDTGACFPAATALWVDGAGACDDAGAGDEGAPLCTISEALGRVEGATPQAIMVRGATYSNPLVVPAGSVVAIMRVGPAAVEVTASGTASLRIDSGSRLYLDGLDIHGNTMGSGIGCDGADAWIDNTSVRQQMLSGISATGCGLKVRDSVLTRNISEGAFVSGGEVRFENAFITDNGDKNTADNPRGGLALAGGAAATLVYTTLYGNAAYIGGGYSIDCDPDPGDESVTIRNSIAFISIGYSNFNCEDAEKVTRSAISAMNDEPNDDNTGVATAELPMLIAPEPASPGVYRPKPGTKLDAVAMLDEGDPDLDFEGDPRPRGELSFPGADQPP